MALHTTKSLARAPRLMTYGKNFCPAVQCAAARTRLVRICQRAPCAAQLVVRSVRVCFRDDGLFPRLKAALMASYVARTHARRWLSGMQLVEQRLRLLQIKRVKPLRQIDLVASQQVLAPP